MKNRIFVIACLLFSIHAYTQSKPPVEHAAYRVSMIKLISNPEFYNGKRVLVQGFLHNRFEDSALYYSRDKGDYLMMPDAIWLKYSKKLSDSVNLKSCDDKYVSIVGTFNMKDYGHMGSFAGTIEEITSIDVLVNYREKKKR